MTVTLRSDTKKLHHIEKGWPKNDKNSTDARAHINQNVDRKKMLCRVGELRCNRKRLIVHLGYNNGFCRISVNMTFVNCKVNGRA